LQPENRNAGGGPTGSPLPDVEASATETVFLSDPGEARDIAGHHDRHLRLLRDALSVRISMRGETVTLTGERAAVDRTCRLLQDLRRLRRDRGGLRTEDVEAALREVTGETDGGDGDGFRVAAPGRTIRARSGGQAHYMQAMRRHPLVFCSGPAGTGKTYLAVAAAVSALRAGEVRRIVLTRPAIEAGERLGYLPGDFQAKVNPYLRPLYDAIEDMAAPPQLAKYVEMNIVEVAPLAYMRGRTLDHAFIILDEGQNCTSRQMRMFLTRLGASSRAVVTGDISQTDLPPSEICGMVEAMHVLRKVRGVAIVRLGPDDIVRHPLVQDIVDAYDTSDSERGRREADRDRGTDAASGKQD
jgi:phosphate starvation-inducible PhoH-like protein